VVYASAHHVSGGFYGKLPARGDFVGLGLPQGFIRPWDAWLQQAIAGSREHLGGTWTAAWLEAPIWRFLLPPGLCGSGGVLGLWLPSVDRAGRFFPLTFARIVEGPAEAVLRQAGGWLDAAEAAGCAALAEDLAPDAIAAMLASPVDAATAPPPMLPAVPAPGGVWWTAGAPRVAAAMLTLQALPDGRGFAAMLDDAARGACRPAG